jgi:hypothetical protein
MYPVPVLGKGFREASGVTLFNRLIYANETLDQIVPFTAELFINFHVAGVIAGFAFLGCSVAVFQDKFAGTRTALDGYLYLFISSWISALAISSIAAVTQIFIYMAWPLYGYMLVRMLGRRRYS